MGFVELALHSVQPVTERIGTTALAFPALLSSSGGRGELLL